VEIFQEFHIAWREKKGTKKERESSEGGDLHVILTERGPGIGGRD